MFSPFTSVALRRVSDVGLVGVFHGPVYRVSPVLSCALGDLTCRVLKVELHSELDSVHFHQRGIHSVQLF